MIIKQRYPLGIWVEKKAWAQPTDQGVIKEIVWAEKAAQTKPGSIPRLPGLTKGKRDTEEGKGRR